MLKSAVGMVRGTINLNSARAGGEPREVQTDPLHPHPPSISLSSQNIPGPPSHLPWALPSPSPVCKIHKLPLFYRFHIYTLTHWPLLGVCTSPQPRTDFHVLTDTSPSMFTVAFHTLRSLLTSQNLSLSPFPAMDMLFKELYLHAKLQSNVEKLQLLWFYSEVFHNMKQLLRLLFFLHFFISKQDFTVQKKNISVHPQAFEEH